MSLWGSIQMISDQVSPEAVSAFQEWISRHRAAMQHPECTDEWVAARSARERYARQHDTGFVQYQHDVEYQLIETHVDTAHRRGHRGVPPYYWASEAEISEQRGQHRG
jgi:hypothetical protein